MSGTDRKGNSRMKGQQLGPHADFFMNSVKTDMSSLELTLNNRLVFTNESSIIIFPLSSS